MYRSNQTERDNNSTNCHAQYTTVRTSTFNASVTDHNHLMAWFGPAPTLPRPQLFSSVNKSSNQTDHSPSVNAHTIVTHSLPVKCGASRPLASKTNAVKSWRGCLSLLLVSWPFATHSRVPMPGVPDWYASMMVHRKKSQINNWRSFHDWFIWKTFVSDSLAKCVSGNCDRVPTTRVLGQVMWRMLLILHSQIALSMCQWVVVIDKSRNDK